MNENKELKKDKYEHPQIECVGKLSTLILMGDSGDTGPGGNGDCTPVQQDMGLC